MPFPHNLADLTVALSHALPVLSDEKRKEHLTSVMTLVYESGVVEGRLQILDKMIKEFQQERAQEKATTPLRSVEKKPA
jgi:hypothetical protein